MKKIYDEITFTPDHYGSREKMFEAIAVQLKLLMDNEYICKIYDDDTDIIVIQFAHNNNIDDWGGPYLDWLDADERERIDCYQDVREEEKRTKKDERLREERP